MGFTPFAFRFIKHLSGDRDELVMLLPTQAGSAQLIEPGLVCVLSAGNMVPLQADQGMSSVVAISKQRVVAADLAGYRPFIIPRPGDVFEAFLATASAATRTTSLYMTDTSGTTQNLATSGTNVLGTIWDTAGYPIAQGRADIGDVVDRGTTVTSVPKVFMTIKASTSYFNALQA